MNKEFILELRSDPRFVSLVEEIMKHRPVIPSHNPRDDKSVEVWKHESAKKEGFDIWVTFLRLENKNA